MMKWETLQRIRIMIYLANYRCSYWMLKLLFAYGIKLCILNWWYIYNLCIFSKLFLINTTQTQIFVFDFSNYQHQYVKLGKNCVWFVFHLKFSTTGGFLHFCFNIFFSKIGLKFKNCLLFLFKVIDRQNL